MGRNRPIHEGARLTPRWVMPTFVTEKRSDVEEQDVDQNGPRLKGMRVNRRRRLYSQGCFHRPGRL
jgi:hypothetical protein